MNDAIRDLLSYERRPREVRIICPIVTDPEICDGNTFLKIIKRLSQVEDIIISLITCKPIARSRASEFVKKEVKKRLDVIQALEDMKIRVFQWPSTDLHAKIILTQSKDDKLALVTSANITPTALNRNIEVGICFKNERDDIYDAIYKYITELLKRIISKQEELRLN